MKALGAWWRATRRSVSRLTTPVCWSTSTRSTIWQHCTRRRAPMRNDRASSADELSSLRRGAAVSQAEQRVHRLAHLVADHRLRVVMGAVLGQDEALRFSRALEQRA